MKLNELTYAPGSRKGRKRVGRGQGSGHGGTSCRGHKGQRSRSGSKRRAWFEGGQMPLQRRVPKRGFRSLFRKEYQIVNVEALNKIGGETPISPEVLRAQGLVKKKTVPIKILGRGNLTKKLTVLAHKFSRSAAEKIEKAGGKVQQI